jgi:TraX protein.
MKKGLNASQLKLIAIIAMTIDHLTWAFFPGTDPTWYVLCLHIIGRLTAPIMWFFIAEGCHYTHNIKKYASRLFIFAVISHFAYNFAFDIPLIPFSGGSIFNQTSVLWSLTLGVVAIAVARSEKFPKFLKFPAILLMSVLGFPSDWSSIAVMCPLALYTHRGDRKRQAVDIVLWTFIYATVYFIFLDRLYGALQMFTFLTIPLLALYNGERGGMKKAAIADGAESVKMSKPSPLVKWSFYIYYPAHLVVVGLIKVALYGWESALIFQ